MLSSLISLIEILTSRQIETKLEFLNHIGTPKVSEVDLEKQLRPDPFGTGTKLVQASIAFIQDLADVL